MYDRPAWRTKPSTPSVSSGLHTPCAARQAGYQAAQAARYYAFFQRNKFRILQLIQHALVQRLNAIRRIYGAAQALLIQQLRRAHGLPDHRAASQDSQLIPCPQQRPHGRIGLFPRPNSHIFGFRLAITNSNGRIQRQRIANHGLQLIACGGVQHRQPRHLRQKRIAVHALMRHAVFNQPRAIHQEAHRQMLLTHVQQDLIIRALQKAIVNRHKGARTGQPPDPRPW